MAVRMWVRLRVGCFAKILSACTAGCSLVRGVAKPLSKWRESIFIFIIYLILSLLGVISLSVVLVWLTFAMDPYAAVPYGVVGLGLLVALVFCKGYQKKNLLYFSTMFIGIGMAFILAGSIVQLPYSVSHSVRQDRVEDLTPAIGGHDTANPFSWMNNSLQVLNLAPNHVARFTLYREFLEANRSIFQIEVATTGPIRMNIVRLDIGSGSFSVDETYLSRAYHSSWFENQLDLNHCYWSDTLWTLPDDHYCTIGFTFENPSNQSDYFAFKVSEYNLKAVVTQQDIAYRTLLDSNFAYVGMALVGLAVAVDVFPYVRMRRFRAEKH